MKKLISRTFIAIATIAIFASVSYTNAQENVQDKAQPLIIEAQIKTSAVCDMCQSKIEKALKKVDGVQEANLNVDTKIATVKYESEKTDIDKLRATIAKVGYNADEVKADEKAYNKLPKCCKSEEVHKEK
ncbi:MAG: MerP protein [Ignavibacteria bacterium]|nr:MerP protein [Ignavibacteria bacterium]